MACLELCCCHFSICFFKRNTCIWFFLGRHGVLLQNTTQPWHNRLPQSHSTAAHTSCLFIALLSSSSTPPYFFNQFQGSCKTSWDFAKRPQQHLFFPLCSRVRGVLPSGPALLGKGRTFPQLSPIPPQGQDSTEQASPSIYSQQYLF